MLTRKMMSSIMFLSETPSNLISDKSLLAIIIILIYTSFGHIPYAPSLFIRIPNTGPTLRYLKGRRIAVFECEL